MWKVDCDQCKAGTLMNVVVVGQGRVGRGLAKRAKGSTDAWRVVSGGRLNRRVIGDADLVILAVPDATIVSVSRRIAPLLRRGACVLHCAGARSPEELSACRRAGAHVGAMHPLASFADPARPPALDETTFVVSGDRKAVTAARRVAGTVGARTLNAPIHGPAYHALAALVAGGSVGFAHAVIPGLVGLGIDRREAERAAAGLIGTVAQNIARIGLPGALTGPVIRGDADAVAAHRRALEEVSPSAAASYDAVAPLVLDCAIAAGLDPGDVARMRRALGEKPVPPRR